MTAFVVDVNVAVVANDKSSQADEKCVISCIEALEKVIKNIIVIDDKDDIFSEYRRNLSMSGQPGAGDEFMYWCYQNEYKESYCERVTIKQDDEWGYEEFPHDEKLGRITDSQKFDLSDRKYVAVALASSNKPEILNAVDSDWKQFQSHLLRHKVIVKELCPQCLK